MSQFSSTVTLAMTGASGVQYALRLLACLVEANVQINVLVSDAARVVTRTETDIEFPADEQMVEFLTQRYQAKPGQIRFFTKQDWFSPVASGSASPAATVICPCSGGCLAAIANGMSNNLIERAADVALKERRKLIVVPRETPVSEIHLENMLKLTRMGAVVLPASPGYYHNPQSIEDLIDFVVGRILDQLGIAQTVMPKWGE